MPKRYPPPDKLVPAKGSRGGRRFGAGRPKGSPGNRAVIIRATGAMDDDAHVFVRKTTTPLTPLAVMLDNMRFAHAHAQDILAKLIAMKIGVDDPQLAIHQFREMLKLRGMAQDAAEAAAPYVHPRLSAQMALKEDAPLGKLESEVKAILDFEEMEKVYGLPDASKNH